MNIMTLEEMLQNEIALWTEKNRPAVAKAISEAHGNERPGTAVGDIVHCLYHGKVKKADLDGLRYFMGL